MYQKSNEIPSEDFEMLLNRWTFNSSEKALDHVKVVEHYPYQLQINAKQIKKDREDIAMAFKQLDLSPSSI